MACDQHGRYLIYRRVMETVILVSLLSQRTPILPPFFPHANQLGYTPSHPPPLRIPFLDVSEVFDLSHLFSVLSESVIDGLPGLRGIVEWRELIDTNRPMEGEGAWDEDDWLPIGCWSQRMHMYGRPIEEGLTRLRLSRSKPCPVETTTLRLTDIFIGLDRTLLHSPPEHHDDSRDQTSSYFPSFCCRTFDSTLSHDVILPFRSLSTTRHRSSPRRSARLP